MDLKSQFSDVFTLQELHELYPHLFKNHQRSLRDRKDVLREFDSEKYGAVLKEMAIGNNLESAKKNVRTKSKFFDGQSIREDSTAEISEIYNSKVFLELHPFLGSIDSVVEIGCGLGEILRYIYSKNPNKKFTGMDLSQNALKIIALESQADCQLINTVQFDINDFEVGTLGSLDDSLVYTSLLMMYSESDAENLLEELLNSRAKFLVFIEPISAHYLELGLWGEWATEYFRYNRYADQWFFRLSELLCNRLEYSFIAIKRNFFAHHILLPVSVVILERRENLNE